MRIDGRRSRWMCPCVWAAEERMAAGVGEDGRQLRIV
jgi:hypothetical protein